GVLAFFDQSALSLFPAYALSHGVTEAAAAAGVATLVLGNTALQIPIGWLADHLPRKRMDCSASANQSPTDGYANPQFRHLWDCWNPATSYCDTAFGFLEFPFGSGLAPA